MEELEASYVGEHILGPILLPVDPGSEGSIDAEYAGDDRLVLGEAGEDRWLAGGGGGG